MFKYKTIFFKYCEVCMSVYFIFFDYVEFLEPMIFPSYDYIIMKRDFVKI